MPFCYEILSLPLRGREAAGCRGHPRAVARRAGRGVPRRASLPAKRPSNNVPSKPSPQGKVPNEERRKRCSTQGVSSREAAIELHPLIRPRFAHPPFPKGKAVAPRASLPLRGREVAGCSAFSSGGAKRGMPGASPSGGPKGRKRCSAQGVPSREAAIELRPL